MRNKIPTFRPNGTPGRDYSPEAIVKLEAAGRVLVERDASGFIEAAQFLPKPDPKPTQRNTIPTGTYYSYEELIVAAGHKAWAHKDLVEDAEKLVGEEKRDVEDFLLGVFRATQLSCMSAGDGSPAVELARVVSIGTRKHATDAQKQREEKRRRRAERRRQARLERKRSKKK